MGGRILTVMFYLIPLLLVICVVHMGMWICNPHLEFVLFLTPGPEVIN